MVTRALSPAAQKTLQKKVSALLAEHDLLSLRRGLPDEDEALLWKAVAHDALDVVNNAFHCAALQHTAIDAARATTLAEHLARATPEPAWQAILPHWPRHLDALVLQAYRLAPEALEARAALLPPWARRGLALAQKRRGRALPSALAVEVALGLAEGFPCGGAFGWSFESEGDELPPLRVDDVDDVRALAARFDEDTARSAAWDEALARAVDANAWLSISPVRRVLERAPLDRLVAQLDARRAPSDQARLEDRWVIRLRDPELVLEEALLLLEARADPPDDLLHAAEQLVAQRGRATALTTALALVAAARVAPIEVDRLERLVSLAVVVEHAALLPRWIAVASALPRDEVLRWARRALSETSAAVVLLAAHFDAALFERALREGPAPSPHAIGSVGAPGLPALLAAISGPTSDPARQERVRHGLVFLLDAIVRGGEVPDEALDLELLVAAFDGRPLERAPYQWTLTAATERVLCALPSPRRRAILDEARTSAPMSVSWMLHALLDDAERDHYLGLAVHQGHVTACIFELLGARAVAPLLAHAATSTQPAWVHDEARRGLPADVFARVADAFVAGSKWRLIEADFARACAADPDAPRRRVYLLERASMAYARREGSLSRVGGSAPVLPAGAIPKGSDGRPQRHLFTLDLADIPELAARHPGAAALAFFCPDTEGDADDATWIALAKIAAPPERASGDPLAVRGFDAPELLFSASEQALAPEARAALDRVRHASGHVFAKPFCIHRSPGQGDGFFLQVSEDLAGAGSPFEVLQFFEDGSALAEVD